MLFGLLHLHNCLTRFFFNHSVSDIRDDIMSPRTTTNTNLTCTGATETTEIHKNHPAE